MMNGQTPAGVDTANDSPLVAGSPPGDNEDVIEEERVPLILRYITLLCRLWGVVTLICLWAFMVLTLKDLDKFNPYAPWYLLGITLLMTFIELVWLMNKCVTCRVGLKSHRDDDSASFTYSEADLSRRDGCCCTCWRLLVWLDNWRKALLYMAFGIPMFIRELVTVYTIVAGLVILIAATLYFIKSFKDSKCVARRSRKHANIQTSGLTSNYAEKQPPSYQPSSYGYQSIHHDTPGQLPRYSEINGKPPSTQPEYNRPTEVPHKTPSRSKAEIQDDSIKPVEESETSRPPPPLKQKQSSGDSSSDVESTSKQNLPPKSSSDSTGSTKPKNTDGEFKLFGLLRKEEKRKEPVVAMVSSQRSEEEDLEQYPDDKNPFAEDEKSEFEWDPDNRG